MRRTTKGPLTDGAKVLVAYYSRSGNTREIARRFHQVVGGDIVEIEPVDPYPDDYHAVVKQANAEPSSGYLPPLQTNVENIGSYDVLFLDALVVRGDNAGKNAITKWLSKFE